MKNLGLYFFYHLCILVLLCSSVYSQNTDSLWKVYTNKTQPDTSRLNAINDLAWSYYRNDPDTAIALAELELQLARPLKAKRYEADALHTMGTAYSNKGNYDRALECFLKALPIFESAGDKKGEANCYNNMGETYRFRTDYPKALHYYLMALKIREENGYRQAVGGSYNNIGNVYYIQSDYPKALEYYQRSLKVREETGDKTGKGTCYNNIANVYWSQEDYEKCLSYYFKGLKIYEEIGDKNGLGFFYNNIAGVYRDQSDYTKALDYYSRSLKMREEIGDVTGVVTCYRNMGELYAKLPDYKRAIEYSKLALQKNREIGDIENERYVYENLAKVYSKTGNYKEAYGYHVKFKRLTDSIFNEENSKQLGDMKTQFEVEKKEAELKIKSEAEQDKMRAVSAEEKKRQYVIISGIAGVLLIVSVFSLFLYKRFRLTQKQKLVIEEQKVLVDTAYEKLHEKNKEVLDSIYYARRIQRALITPERYIQKQLQRLRNKT